MKRIVLLAIGLSLLFCTPALADNKATAMDLVNKAIAMSEAQGTAAAFAEMNKAGGAFSNAEGMYVFAYDMTGTMASHPKAALIGKNLLEKTDTEGKYFRKEIIETAKAKGEGWVDYKYRDTATNKLGDKTTFVKKFKEFVFCCGFVK